MQIRKITVETASTGSGTVTIYYRGQLMTSKALALLMTAVGLLNLAASEEIRVQIASGPPSAQVKVTSHFNETSPTGAEPERGLAWTDAVGFTEPVDNPVLIGETTNFNIDLAPDHYESPLIDLRAYNSYILTLRATKGTYVDTDTIRILISFYATPTTTDIHYQDSYTIFPTNAAGSSLFNLTDIAHGPYMRLWIENDQSVPRDFNLTYQLYGSYRQLPATWLRTAPNGVLAEYREFLGAGANVTRLSKLGLGRAMVTLASSPSGGAALQIRYASSILQDDLVAPGAAQRVSKEIIMPRLQPRIIVTNNAGAADFVDFYIVQQFYPQ